MSTDAQTADAANDFVWNFADGQELRAAPADIPVNSLHRMAHSGGQHMLGNEVASALTAWRKTEEGKAADDAAIKSWVFERRQKKLEQILSGTLGVRTTRSIGRATGLDAVIRTVAIEWLKAKLGKSGNKLPTGDKTIEVAGKDMTRDDLVDFAIARADKLVYSPGVTIRAEAERRHGEQEGIVAGVDELFS